MNLVARGGTRARARRGWAARALSSGALARPARAGGRLGGAHIVRCA